MTAEEAPDLRIVSCFFITSDVPPVHVVEAEAVAPQPPVETTAADELTLAERETTRQANLEATRRGPSPTTARLAAELLKYGVSYTLKPLRKPSKPL